MCDLFIATAAEQVQRRDWHASTISKTEMLEYEFEDILHMVYDTLARHL